MLLPKAPKETLQASMTTGELAPTELILSASVKPAEQAYQLGKGSSLPDGDYMRDKFKYQPYRVYDVLFATDAERIRLPRGADGLHHGKVEFVAVVYNGAGDVVNSFLTTISLDLRETSYQTLLKTGLGNRHPIAVPVKGEYFLRLGVHDVTADRVGVLEVPLSEVKLGAGLGKTE